VGRSHAARCRARARRMPVRRVTHGDSRSLTEQPPLPLTCAATGPPRAATSFASRGSQRRDTARRWTQLAESRHMSRTYLRILGSWRGTRRHGRRRWSSWQAACPGTCSPGNGMSAMVPGGRGCPGFMRQWPTRSQGGPGTRQEPAPAGVARGLQGSAVAGAWLGWANPAELTLPPGAPIAAKSAAMTVASY
jgi:hypothetical protein